MSIEENKLKFERVRNTRLSGTMHSQRLMSLSIIYIYTFKLFVA